MKAIIVDDEKSARNTLSTMLKEFFPEVKVLGEAASPQEAIGLIKKVEPQVAFLDIEMQSGTGFDLLESLPEGNLQVIFVTAHADYALESFRFGVADYLTKPVRISDLRQAIERAGERIKVEEPDIHPGIGMRKYAAAQREYQLTLPESDGFAVVPVEEIIRCEGSRNYTIFTLRDGKQITAARTLKDFETMLAPYGFIRVHKSHLVNGYSIRRYFRGRGGELEMEDGQLIPVSRERKSVLMEHFSY